MENWRGFVTETAKAQSYGDLYLFENGTVSTVSFYDKLNTLTESEEETTRFLEQWEKSIDYEFDRLNEIDVKSLTTDSIAYLLAAKPTLASYFRLCLGSSANSSIVANTPLEILTIALGLSPPAIAIPILIQALPLSSWDIPL